MTGSTLATLNCVDVGDLKLANNNLGQGHVLVLENDGLANTEHLAWELHEELLHHVIGVVRILRDLLLVEEVDVELHVDNVVLAIVRLDNKILVDIDGSPLSLDRRESNVAPLHSVVGLNGEGERAVLVDHDGDMLGVVESSMIGGTENDPIQQGQSLGGRLASLQTRHDLQREQTKIPVKFASSTFK